MFHLFGEESVLIKVSKGPNLTPSSKSKCMYLRFYIVHGDTNSEELRMVH